MKTMYLWVMIVLPLAGCRSVETVVVERVKKDTVLDIKERRDTFWLSDSVVVKEWMRGDTVWIERSRHRSKERVRVVADTIREVRIDSIPMVITPQDNQGAIDSGRCRRLPAVISVVLAIVFLLILIKRRK